MRHAIYTLAFLSACLSLQAQTQTQQNSAEVLQSIKKLNTVGAVLYVAAHPDDENTRLLAYFAGEKRLRTGYLSLTRGDGGQNLVGKEQGEALGLIRTNELLAARRIDGAEQFFTRANDFGYSKNPEETFAFWNKDSILADAVWVIRKFRPDVIVCRFPTTGEGGHGHHTASAIIAEEAFEAAADPLRFPEQLKHVNTWNCKRIYWNTFNFGGANTTAEDQAKIDIGVFNPLLGKYYGEIAADSRSMHKSQGFGAAKLRGSAIEYFKFIKGDSSKVNIFKGIEHSWKRFKETEKIGNLLNQCIQKYNPQEPYTSVKSLVAIYNELQKINSFDPELLYWKQQKLKECENVILSAAGFWAEAYAANYLGITGSPIDITAQMLVKYPVTITLNKIHFLQDDSLPNLQLKRNELYSMKHRTLLDKGLSFTNPYWLNEKHFPGLYTVADPLLRGTPENSSATKVIYDVTLASLNLKVERPITYKYTDPVKGEVYRPFEILPPATINIAEKVFVFPDDKAKKVQFVLKANANNISGEILAKASEGWIIKLKESAFSLAAKGEEVIVDAEIIPSAQSKTGSFSLSLKINDQLYSKSIQRIEYDHIPYQFILSNAEAKLEKIELKKTISSVAYIPGAGDDIPACLKQIGYDVTILNDDALKNTDLTVYDAIVTGIRAYNTNERLQVYYNKLMDYVNNGGNLIVQYNTNNRIGPVGSKIGPYPFVISRNRVTDENATVTFNKGEHPALNYPNKITDADFENWVQERGIYFASEVDKKYESILSMNDPTEKANDGSLIVGKYGKGNFVYTGLVFFRELPAGVPGAYRLFVNLLSLPKEKNSN